MNGNEVFERIEVSPVQHITLHRPERDIIEVILMSTNGYNNPFCTEPDMKTDSIRFCEKVYRKWIVERVIGYVEYGFFVVYHYYVPEFDRLRHIERDYHRESVEREMLDRRRIMFRGPNPIPITDEWEKEWDKMPPPKYPYPKNNYLDLDDGLFVINRDTTTSLASGGGADTRSGESWGSKIGDGVGDDKGLGI